MKRIFVTFADTRYIKSLERIKSETELFDFDERYFLTEKDLPKDFFQNINPKIYRRGYGYWTWKPYVVKSMLDKMKDGDVLVYSDAGTQYHITGKQRFEEYLLMLSVDKPFVVFQQPFLAKDWTKGDVFKYLCAEQWQVYAMQLQLWAGSFILLKTPNTVAVVDKWLDIVKNHIDLMTDKASESPNLVGFQEHRHDQSVFSILIHQMPHTEISWQEVESLDGIWNGRDVYPIWAKRDKSFSFIGKIKKRLRLLLSYPIGLYLKYIKGFYFQSKIAW